MIGNWKPQTPRNPEYLQFIREQPCCVPGCHRTPSDPHHVKEKGTSGFGLKPPDTDSVPLCRNHHREGETPGMSWKAFQAKYQIDFRDVQNFYLKKFINRGCE